MQILSTIKRLCRPAYIYLIISVFSLAAVIYQNAGNTTKYCFGDFACKVSSTSSVLLTHGLYIIFWTFVLNSLCNAGYDNLSWFILLLPIIIGFILIGLLILNSEVIN